MINRSKNVRRNRGTSDLLYVRVKDNTIEKALKILKQRVKENGLLVELKEKSFYQKPSDKRRSIKNKAKLRTKRDLEQVYKKLY